MFSPQIGVNESIVFSDHTSVHMYYSKRVP